MGFEQCSFAARLAHEFLEGELAILASYLLAHDVGICGFVKQASTLLVWAVEKVELDRAVFALDVLTELGFLKKDGFIWAGASGTLNEGPVDFSAVLKADVGVEGHSGFDGFLRDSLASGTEDLNWVVVGVGAIGLRHGWMDLKLEGTIIK